MSEEKENVSGNLPKLWQSTEVQKQTEDHETKEEKTDEQHSLTANNDSIALPSSALTSENTGKDNKQEQIKTNKTSPRLSLPPANPEHDYDNKEKVFVPYQRTYLTPEEANKQYFDRPKKETRFNLTNLLAGIIIGLLTTILLLMIYTTFKSEEQPTQTIIRETPVAANQKGFSAQQIYRKDSKSVVFIATTSSQNGIPQISGSGSGFIVSETGEVVTNAHVIDKAEKVIVQTENEKSYEAKVLAEDPSTDLALLKIQSDDKFQPMQLGDSNKITVGDPVLALGNPFGLERTLTQGIVSAVGRTIPSLTKFRIPNVIQTDAAINPGNSGGPLLDSQGKVIGVNSQIQTGSATSRGNVGIAFAIPINTVKKLLPEMKKGKIEHAFLGVTTATITPAYNKLNLNSKTGVLIQTVTPGSPAEKAGLKGGTKNGTTDNGTSIKTDGDIITKINDKPVKKAEDIITIIDSYKPNDKIKITIIRQNQEKTVEATLAKRQ